MHLSGWEEESVCGVSPQIPLGEGRVTARREQLGVVASVTCRAHAKAGRGREGCGQAHSAGIYSAITATTEAVQSTTGCQNSLWREQESQQKDREGHKEITQTQKGKMETGENRRGIEKGGRAPPSLRLRDKVMWLLRGRGSIWVSKGGTQSTRLLPVSVVCPGHPHRPSRT